ncbi:MAG: dihydropyrimidinase, partial [Paraburkholderia sp.]|nr:dihydropyrimidinase [Paraburkholderia sp.]
MNEFDLTIRGGTVASDVETFRADIGIVGDRIVAVENELPAGRRDI